MQEPLNKNEMIEKIARQLRCSSCGRRYRREDFRIMGEYENFAVMRIACRECHKQSVVFAIVQQRRVRPVFSDLEPEEWRYYSRQPAVSADDVLRLHREFKAYDGDFGDVLEDPFLPDAPEE
jgi:hypothetical protein